MKWKNIVKKTLKETEFELLAEQANLAALHVKLENITKEISKQNELVNGLKSKAGYMRRGIDYICETCKDTHKMYMSSLGRDVMCTYCPAPCQKCKGGPFCASTPCDCDCHPYNKK